MVVPADKPNEPSALVPPAAITRFCDVPVLRTSLPALMVEAVAVPVMPSIAERTSPTVSVLPAPTPIVTLPLESEVTLVCEVLKVMDLPSTVKLEPFAGVAASVSEFVAETSLVAVVIATAEVRLFRTAEPVTVLLVPGPSRLLAVAPVMAVEVTLDFVE